MLCTNLRAGLAMSANGRVVRSSLAAVLTPFDSIASLIGADAGPMRAAIISIFFFVTERWPK
ncbi:hypothetical protein CHELA20_10378 [Hyphomicrobiales bacterium]|nr:hypothetical protein CHELA20_10378 [Hyphomicrobiales bacterium]CAH1691888.1 hypothetical protein CHELA41_50606 [Hyphomicrobiales bacterium]